MESIINRHIGKCLDSVDKLCPKIDPLAKIAIKREMRFLAEDIKTHVTARNQYGEQNEEAIHEETTQENFNR